MAKERKKRTQYNWKFRENESEEFYQWFNNQENISNSLRSILYHVIDLYGNGDILEPEIQKKLITNGLILESLQDKKVININHQLISDTSSDTRVEVGTQKAPIKSEPEIKVSEKRPSTNPSNEAPEKTESKIEYDTIDGDLL